jgi:hypothetical protein
VKGIFWQRPHPAFGHLVVSRGKAVEQQFNSLPIARNGKTLSGRMDMDIQPLLRNNNTNKHL